MSQLFSEGGVAGQGGQTAPYGPPSTSPVAAQPTPPGAPGGTNLLDYARSLVGTKYVYGGKSLATGVDCSGFTQAVFAQYGINIGGDTSAQRQAQGARVGSSLADLRNAEPGDLLFFGDVAGAHAHVGIYLGGGQMISAPNASSSVRIDDVAGWDSSGERLNQISRVNGTQQATQGLSAQGAPVNVPGVVPGGGGGTGTTGTGTPAAKPSVAFDPNKDYPITPDVQKWIAQNAGQDAWMTTNPELAKILGYVGENQITDPNEVQALVAQTQWYKTHATAQRAWVQLYAADPAEAARAIQVSQQTVKDLAGKLGVTLTPDQLNQLSINDNYFGWNANELQKAVAQFLGPRPNAGDAGNTLQQLRETANQFLVPISDQTLSGWTQQIVSGEAQPDAFNTYIKDQAKSMFPSMGAAIDSGITPQQFVEPYRQLASSTLEIDPQSINFMDPKWMQFVNQVDPKTGQRTEMGLGAAANYLRSNPIFGYQNTTGARNQAYNTVQQLTQSLGAIA